MEDYWSYLNIDDLTIFDRQVCDSSILFLFLPSDLKTYEEEVEEDEFRTCFIYTQTAKVIKERLEVQHITLERARKAFDILQSKKIEYLKSMDFYLYDSEINLLETNSYEDFLSALKEILDNKYYQYKNKKSESSLVNYLLYGIHGSDNHGNGKNIFYNLPLCYIDFDNTTDLDFWFVKFEFFYLRILIELVPETTLITYDLTEVFDGYGQENDEDKEYIYSLLLSQFGEFPYEDTQSGIIILTEGSTDTEFLKDSIDILFPYMKYHYSFMNYDVKVSGGADALMKTVRTFAGLNNQDKIIILFDNDTAGLDAIRVLSKDNIDYERKSIKILSYPNLAIADNYPTIDKNGLITEENINERACSIEMYLGKDVLTNEQGQLIPVKWGKEVPSMKQLQGEISDKTLIQKKFRQKLKACKQDPSLIENYDWDGIKSILKVIFKAFNE